MAELNSTIEPILKELSRQKLNGNQVGAILNNPIEFPKELIEDISLATAMLFWKGQITYREGDCIMNNLNNYWMSNDIFLNDTSLGIAWECFLAFDSGEFCRDDDDKNIRPSEKYTKPLVESILKKQRLI